MTYRLPDKPPKRRRHLVDVATPSVICVDNGSISRIEIPCDYIHPACHDRMLHDHLGWPEPRRHDRSCQLAAGEEKKASTDKFLALIDKYESFDTLTNTMLNEFVEKIIVHERARKGSTQTTQELEIYFNFIGRFHASAKRHR